MPSISHHDLLSGVCTDDHLREGLRCAERRLQMLLDEHQSGFATTTDVVAAEREVLRLRDLLGLAA